MSTKAGQLLWNRKRIHLVSDGQTPVVLDVDTGLCQTTLSFGSSSDSEPPMGTPGVAAPLPGTLPASRIQVIPLAPTVPWDLPITHSEPWFSTVTNTVHVTFFAPALMPSDETPVPTDVKVNVLFWDPHTEIGPGQADPYNDPIIT